MNKKAKQLYKFHTIKKGGKPMEIKNPERPEAIKSAAYSYAYYHGLSFKIRTLPDRILIYNL